MCDKSPCLLKMCTELFTDHDVFNLIQIIWGKERLVVWLEEAAQMIAGIGWEGRAVFCLLLCVFEKSP